MSENLRKGYKRTKQDISITSTKIKKAGERYRNRQILKEKLRNCFKMVQYESAIPDNEKLKMTRSSWDYIIFETMRKGGKQNKIKRCHQFEELEGNIDCTSNLKYREYVELVDRAEVEKYVEHDREVITNRSLK